MAVKEKILLNVCCGNCATHCVNALREEGFEPVMYFYNPNIYPEEEFKKRYSDVLKLADITGAGNIENPPYEVSEWKKRCGSLAGEPEGGRRCAECFRLKMEKTAEKTKELGFEIFASTLTISPHKNAALINRLGNEAAKNHGVKYYESNFKKKNGFKKSVELSKKYGFYRQKYCGCVYSMNDR